MGAAVLMAPALTALHLRLLGRQAAESPLRRGPQAASAVMRMGVLGALLLAAGWLLRGETAGLLLGLALYPSALLAAALTQEGGGE